MGCSGSKSKKKPPPEPEKAEPLPEVSPHWDEKAQDTEVETPVALVPRPSFRIGLGSTFPDFYCRTTKGNFQFHEFLKDQNPFGWTMLFSHPKDFTPVCTTEIGTCQSWVKEFRSRHVQLIGLSCDSVEQHKKWSKDVLATIDSAQEELDFPLIADEDRSIAERLGMLDPSEVCDVHQLPMPARALFLIGPEKRTHLAILYPATTGRNFTELLRCIDSLRISSAMDRMEVGTAANWHAGDDVMPAVSAADQPDRFNIKTTEMPSKKRYIRYMSHPEIDARTPIKAYAEAPGNFKHFKMKLGAKFPDFDWSATKQGINRFHHLLDRLQGDLALMIVWPRNFEPVATTELVQCLKELPEFRKRKVSLIGMTCDPVEDLQQWVKDTIHLSGSLDEDMGFTIIADGNQHIAAELGLVPHEAALDMLSSARGLFVIDKEKTLRLSMHYPMTTGFNFAEILRVLDSLHLTKEGRYATPANWTQGSRIILDPKVRDVREAVQMQHVPSGLEYLRWVEQPELPWQRQELILPKEAEDEIECEPLAALEIQKPKPQREAWWLCGCGA